MSDIEDLERRIAAALDRIGGGIDALSAPQPDAPAAEAPESGELKALREALAAERETNAQLEERGKTIRDRLQGQVSALEQQVETLKGRVGESQAQVQKVRQVNNQLREAAQRIREAGAVGVTDPDLINQAVLAELDGLRAARDADRDALETLVSELEPHLKEQADA